MIEVRAAGVLVRDSSVLLVRHEKPHASYWVVPGGHVDFGETVEETVRREYSEELSMSVGLDSLVFVNDSVPADGSRHVLNLYFKVNSDDEIGNLDGVTDARFFGAREIGELDLRPAVGGALTELMECGSAKKLYLGNLWE